MPVPVIHSLTHDDDAGRGGGEGELGIDLSGEGDDALANDHGLRGELTTGNAKSDMGGIM